MQQRVELYDDSGKRLLKIMEEVPVQAYMAAAGASVLASGLLYLLGRRNLGMYMAQLPVTILGSVLVYRLLKPSRERPSESLEKTVDKARDAVDLAKDTMKKRGEHPAA